MSRSSPLSSLSRDVLGNKCIGNIDGIPVQLLQALPPTQHPPSRTYSSKMKGNILAVHVVEAGPQTITDVSQCNPLIYSLTHIVLVRWEARSLLPSLRQLTYFSRLSYSLVDCRWASNPEPTWDTVDHLRNEIDSQPAQYAIDHDFLKTFTLMMTMI